jgi:hypothetical protein
MEHLIEAGDFLPRALQAVSTWGSWTAMLNRPVAVALALHAIAHLPGFVTAWRLAELQDLPYGTVVLNGTLDVGEPGIRVVGLLWLVGSAAFVASAVLLALGTRGADRGGCGGGVLPGGRHLWPSRERPSTPAADPSMATSGGRLRRAERIGRVR